jgi:hypothetical protein
VSRQLVKQMHHRERLAKLVRPGLLTVVVRVEPVWLARLLGRPVRIYKICGRPARYVTPTWPTANNNIWNNALPHRLISHKINY